MEQRHRPALRLVQGGQDQEAKATPRPGVLDVRQGLDPDLDGKVAGARMLAQLELAELLGAIPAVQRLRRSRRIPRDVLGVLELALVDTIAWNLHVGHRIRVLSWQAYMQKHGHREGVWIS